MMETVSENSEGSRVSENVSDERKEGNSVSEMPDNGIWASEQILSKEEKGATLEASISAEGSCNPEVQQVLSGEEEGVTLEASVSNDNSCDSSVETHQTFSEEEVQATLEASASTGKFWQDWEKLKGILSYKMNVLSEYPEAKMTGEEQISLLGETFEEMVKRLDDALHSFEEGPPFTLQRLCELLLSARSIYPKLSKLSLALEKSLLVTSTLTISSDPHQHPANPNSNEACEEVSGNALPQTNSVVENGQPPEVGDRDEIMAEADDHVVPNADMPAEMETVEEVVVKSLDENSTPAAD